MADAMMREDSLTIPMEPVRSRALLRWLPLFCFLLLMGASAANNWTSTAQMGWAHDLGVVVKAGLASREIGALILAGFALLAYAILYVIAQPLILFAAFLLVELALAGRPKSWRLAGSALWLRIGLAFAYLLIKPVEAYIAANGRFGPLIKIDQGQFPDWAAPFIGIVLALCAAAVINFGQYWVHRLQHTVPLLWRFHSVHHAVEDMDSLNSYLHPVDTWGQIVFTLIVTAVIGFQYDAVFWLLAFQNIHDRLLHTRAPIHFGPLGRVFVDNRYHFMHHSVRPEDYNHNYSSLLTCWDHLFGTYLKPHPTVLATTGIIEKLPARNFRQLLLAKLDDRPIAVPDAEAPRS